jgi:hypothetical protein
MKDFENFKRDRMRLDPTAHKFSERQWKRAYAAHRKSLKRVGRQNDADTDSSGASKSSRRRRSKGRKTDQIEKSADAAESSRLRLYSSHRESRLAVETLFWVALGVIALGVLVEILYFSSASAIFSAVLTAALQIIGIVYFRMLFHLVADLAGSIRADKRRNV